MDDLKDRLGRRAALFTPADDAKAAIRRRALRRQRNRRMGAILTVVMVLAGAGWVLSRTLPLGERSQERERPGGAPAKRGVLGESFFLPPGVGGDMAVADDGAIWAAGEDQLWRIDPETGDSRRWPFPEEGIVIPTVWGEGRLWGEQIGRGLVEILPDGEVRLVSTEVNTVVPGLGALWTSSGQRLDSDTGEVTGSVAIGAAHAVAVGGSGVWFATGGEIEELVHVDPSSMEATSRSRGAQFAPMAADNRVLWSGGIRGGELLPISPDGRIGDGVNLGESILEVREVLFAHGYVWVVAIRGPDLVRPEVAVFQVDPRSRTAVGAPIVVPVLRSAERTALPAPRLLVAPDGLWVLQRTSPELHRIDLADVPRT